MLSVENNVVVLEQLWIVVGNVLAVPRRFLQEHFALHQGIT